jgi:endo-1,4-beta-D-glucanase Y
MVRAVPQNDRSTSSALGNATLLLSVVLVVAVSWALVVRASDGPVVEQQTGAGREASQEFFADYVATDGRVIRREQGGDTVSEGQAYALRLALGDGDAASFDRVWSWTRDHLQIGSGLFAWQWKDGAITDDVPVADADLDVAVALSQASVRFHRDDYAAEARRIASAVLDHETVEVGGRLVLVAGPWAVAERVVNPSYLAPCDAAKLATLSADPRWLQLRDSSTLLLGEALSTGLPSDWSVLDPSGRLHPIARPEDRANPGTYGLDAARVPARLWGCEAGRGLSSPLWDRLQHLAADGAYSAYALDGAPLDTRPHPLGLIAGALTAGAAGDRSRAEELIVLAARLEHAQPSYYGAAWLGLAEDMLATISIEIPPDADGSSFELAADGVDTAPVPTSADAPAWWPMAPPDQSNTDGSLWVSVVEGGPLPQGLPAPIPAPPHPPSPPPTNPPTTNPPTTNPPTTNPPTTNPPTTNPPTTEPPTTEPPTTEPPTTEPPTTNPPTTEPPTSTTPPGAPPSVGPP